MRIATTKGSKDIAPKAEAPDRPDIDKGVDALLEAIKQWRSRVDGKDLSKDELLAEATQAIERRIG